MWNSADPDICFAPCTEDSARSLRDSPVGYIALFRIGAHFGHDERLGGGKPW